MLPKVEMDVKRMVVGTILSPDGKRMERSGRNNFYIVSGSLSVPIEGKHNLNQFD